MVQAAILWFSVGPMITLKGHITAKNYVNMLANKVHPRVKTLLPNGDGVSQDGTKPLFTELTSPRTGFLSTRMICHISPAHYSHQTSIILNLYGLHWSYPLPSSLPELCNVLQQDWYKIPLASIQELYLSITRRLQTVLKANGFPTPN